MSSTIKIKRTTVAGKSPTNANLSTGELAINLPDGRLYSYSGSRIFEIGANVHSLHVGSGSFSIGNGSITFPNAVANTGFFLGTDGSGTLSFRNTTPLIKSQLANTNTYIATKTNSASPTTSGVFAHTGRATISTNLTVSGNTVVSKLVANGSVGTAGYVLKSTGSGVYWDAAVGSGTIVSLTTTALKDLTQNDTVVTSAQATSATNYLQVANAVSTFQTKSIERSALANTNSFIKSQLANTNTFIATKVNTTTFNSALANTNTYIATKVNTTTFNSALANTNSFIKSQLANTNLRVNLINTNLTSTNTAIRLLVSDRLQVANAVAIYQTKAVERAALANTNSRITLVNTNLTGTNTAIRLLVSDRLQVANAVATYQTKTIERAALANTNAFIKSQLANTNLRVNLINTNLTGTNTAIRLLVSDRLQVANAAATYATKESPTTSGVFAHTGRATISTNLTVSGNTVIGKLVANGSVGTAGYALKSNGSTVYWDAVGGGQVTTAQFNSALANTNTYIATKTNSASPTTSGVFAHTGRATISTNLNVSGNTVVSKLVANGSVGTAGYVLKSTGSGVYWDAAVGSGTVISLTTTALKDLTQNDTVVTSAQTISASGYLQVANAVSTFQTKSIERAALANTNSYIRSQLANTNTYIATKTNSTNPTTSGILAHTGRATISTNLTVSGNTVIGKLVANGSVGTAGYALKSNGSTVYWDAVGGGQVTTAQFNSALANTNTFIATKTSTTTFNSALANTNTYITSQLANLQAFAWFNS